MRQRAGGRSTTLVLWALLLASGVVFAGDEERSSVATTPHFAFHSDFGTNLNDALIVAGASRKRGASELFHAGSEDGSCFAELPRSARTGWNLAVDYYAEVISPVGWYDRQQYLLRMDLAGLEDELDDRARRFAGIAEGFRMAAAPAYEACRWAVQDAENRRWIEKLTPLLAAHESAIAGRLEELYRMAWHGLPIRVDVVSTAPPVGANTIAEPPHILVSSTTEDADSLEIIHHEGSHTLMGRGAPIRQALADAARELDMELPGDLWHVVLFYTTGQVVRGRLAEAGEPGYTPYIDTHDLWDGPWGRYRDSIEKTWPAYINGERSLPEAASDVLRALGDD